jgi:predicted alpha/beta hydrolase
MSDDVAIEDTTIVARDGYPLAATVFDPPRPWRSALINSATAVPRKIYRSFATFLAQNGFAVLTYDYRGIGGSRPPSLRGFPARMRDWAGLDVSAAIVHAQRRWPTVPLTYVGHSFGGQALGLVPNNSEVSRALFVSAQAAYWRQMPPPENYRVLAMMQIASRVVAPMFGYVPGWTGMGEDMPRDAFVEWTNWVMKPRYFFDDPTLTELQNFPRYRGPLRAIGMTDDPWATAPMIDLLVSGFTGAWVERRQIDPSVVGVKKIGHFGFFRPEHRDTLWRDSADWLAATG